MRCAGLPRSAPTVPGKAGSAGLPPGRRGPSLAAWAPTEWSPGSKRLDAPLAFAWPASPAPGTSAPSAARRPRGPPLPQLPHGPGSGEGRLAGSLRPGVWNLGHSGRPPEALGPTPGRLRAQRAAGREWTSAAESASRARPGAPRRLGGRARRPGPGEGQQQVTTAGPQGYK